MTFTILAAAVLSAGCGGTGMSPNAPTAIGVSSAVQEARSTTVPDIFRKGIYVGEGYVGEGAAIYGYAINKQRVRGPKCTVKGTNYLNTVEVDGAGNLMVPNGGSRTVTVFKGPEMCGPELGSFNDSYGQPSDVASNNASTGTIAVANIFDSSGAGSISVCTLSVGCTKNLTNSNMFEVASDAMAKNGDCWASASNSVGTATLTYFKRCTGPGQPATGWRNTYYGGLTIDIHGYLVALDAFLSQLWIYKGCNPTCTLVAGPFTLRGDSVYASLNEKSTQLAAADFSDGDVDVYAYSLKGLKYEYSFNNGLRNSDEVAGVAFNPRSKE
ncbi:MAG: hypothetical protein WA431_14210 [Candidatus Cybelea sp.]